MSAQGSPPDVYLSRYREGRLHSEPGQPTVLRSAYPVESFYRRERGAFHDELDLTQFQLKPLDPGVLAAVEHLWNLERSTTGQLRNLFAGWTSREARIDAFLTTWAYEKHWIAQALAAVLEVHRGPQAPPPKEEPVAGPAGDSRALGPQGCGSPTTSPGPPRGGDGPAVAFERQIDRLAPTVDSVVTNLIGEDVVAGQMARGLSREAATAALFERLALVADHPVMDHLCSRSLERTNDYVDFFETEARERLLDSPRHAAVLARIALGRGFSPLRPNGVSRNGLQAAVDILAPGVRHRRALCREADARVHDLPYLRGPEPLERSLRAEGIRVRA